MAGKEESASTQINFRILVERLDRLDEAAEEFGKSRGEVIGEMIDWYLKLWVDAQMQLRNAVKRQTTQQYGDDKGKGPVDGSG